MKKKLISVIIPAYNEEGYISKTLEAIKNQKYQPIEIVVIADSCTDKTKSIASKYTDNLYEINERRIAKARNYGAKKANGQILVFNDADTLFSENYLEKIAEFCSEKRDYGCAKMLSETKNPLHILHSKILNYHSKYNHYFHGNFFISKDLFFQFNGFQEKMIKGEDTDLAERLKGKGNYHFLEESHIIPSMRKINFFSFIRGSLEGNLYLYFPKVYYSFFKEK